MGLGAANRSVWCDRDLLADGLLPMVRGHADALKARVEMDGIVCDLVGKIRGSKGAKLTFYWNL